MKTYTGIRECGRVHVCVDVPKMPGQTLSDLKPNRRLRSCLAMTRTD